MNRKDLHHVAGTQGAQNQGLHLGVRETPWGVGRGLPSQGLSVLTRRAVWPSLRPGTGTPGPTATPCMSARCEPDNSLHLTKS